jgi:hypothetical protein
VHEGDEPNAVVDSFSPNSARSVKSASIAAMKPTEAVQSTLQKAPLARKDGA